MSNEFNASDNKINLSLENKKNSEKINSNNLLYLIVGLIVLIIVFSSYFYFTQPSKQFNFEIEKNNVVFQSNIEPKLLLSNFVNEKNFVLIVEMEEQGELNQQMISTAVLLNSVFVFNEKKVILVFKALNPETKELVSCETNKGNVLEETNLSKQECLNYLNELNLPKLIVLFPSQKNEKVKVLLKENEFVIKTTTPKSALIASKTLLELLFEDNEKTLNKINDLASKIYGA